MESKCAVQDQVKFAFSSKKIPCLFIMSEIHLPKYVWNFARAAAGRGRV